MHVFCYVPFSGFLLLVIFLSGRVIQLRKKNVQIHPFKQEKGIQQFPLFIAFAVVLFLWLFEILRPVLHLSYSILPDWLIEPVFQSLILKSAGAVYILLSLILMGKTLHDFGHSFRMGLDKNNRGKLITTGIFSFSRNPFFLALNLFFLGTAMIIPGIFLIVFTLAAIVGSHLFILKEERFMLKNYGESYKSYCKKVRRYL